MTIFGDVRNPAKYWLSLGTDLSTVENVFGGWSGSGMIAPREVILLREIDGRLMEGKFSQKKPGKETVRLQNKDMLFYPRILF